MNITFQIKLGVVLLMCMQLNVYLFSQVDSIYYTVKRDSYVKLHPNDSIEFNVFKMGGLGGYNIVGYGSYKMKKNKFIIRTVEYPFSLESSYEFTSYHTWDSSYSNYKIKIVDAESGYPMAGVIVSTENNNLNFTGKDGFVKILNKSCMQDSYIYISFVGYQQLKIPIKYNSKAELIVKMVEGAFVIIENKKIIIKIEAIENDLFDIQFLN